MFVRFSSLKTKKSVKNLNMKKSAFISDVIFTFLSGTLLTLCLFRYLGASFSIAICLSLPCGILLAAAFAAYRQSKRKTVFLKRSDEAQKEKLLLHLALLSDEAKTNFFKEVFSTHSPSERNTEQIPPPIHKFGRLRLHTPTEFYFLHFRMHPVTADEIASISRLKTGKARTLFCAQIEDSAYALCEKLGIEVKTGAEVYRFLKANEALPKEYLGEESAERKHKRRVQLWFSKSNSKRFLIAGTLVLFTSLLSPFPYYYLVFGGLLLLAALLVRILGYE